MRHIIVLIIANTFWAASATAQSMSPNNVFGRYQQVNWQERDGLPQNTVVAIATTRDGYLWMGTYEGAVRFDGVRFTLFNPSTTTGIGNSFVATGSGRPRMRDENSFELCGIRRRRARTG